MPVATLVALAVVCGFILGLEVLAVTAALVVAGLVGVSLLTRWLIGRRLPPLSKGTVAFFHPFADGGGGGERVLWAAVQALQESRPDVKVAIYCGGDASAEQLCKHVLDRFNLRVLPTFQVVPLPSRGLLLPERYPRLTMLRQCAGSVRVAWHGLRRLRPELWVDTTGWAAPYPVVRLAGARVAAYVHYPTISSDMLRRVRDRAVALNNADDVAASPFLSALKLAYYHTLALAYGAVGACAQVVMVNSSWTQRHIAAMWWRRRPARVYPPCDTSALQALPLDRRLKRVNILSVAQFRPEKDHPLQLRALAEARRRAAAARDGSGDAVLAAHLRLVGSCRNGEDEARIERLRELAEQLGLADYVHFHVNAPFEELRALLGDAVAGLHTMRDEHFGISVVEYMAAGVVPIAHNSAGPREDIVLPEGAPGSGGGGGVQRTGWLCSGVDEYAAAISQVLGMDQRERLGVAAAARRRAAQFSDERFQQAFVACLEPLLPQGPRCRPSNVMPHAGR